jgi:hypothetical protein
MLTDAVLIVYARTDILATACCTLIPQRLAVGRTEWFQAIVSPQTNT